MRAVPRPHPIARLAADQRGIVTRDQLVALGLSRRVIARLLAQGWLHRIHAGVYAVGHPALTREGRWMAATLAVDGVLSHRAAGELWAILPAGQRVDVTLVRATRRAHRDGIVLHHGRLALDDVTVRDGIRLTTLVRTIVDLAAMPHFGPLRRALEEAQVRHHLRPVDLAAEVAGRRGHRGTARLRPLLADGVEPGQVESVLELRFLELCAAHGLPRPLMQVRFGPYRADFWFPEARVAVETDGARFHAGTLRRARDAEKDAALAARGVMVVRTGWTEVTQRPAEVAARLRSIGVGT